MTHHTEEACKEKSHEQIPDDILAQAAELSRGAEILPEGMIGLAKKIHAARKANRSLRVKLGIDPTSTDLHIGHSVVFRKLRRFQEFGHQVVLIIGGFTAQIGDPSGRNTTRPQLTRQQVEENAQTYLNQMGLILDLEKTEVVNNADWLAPLNLNDILKLAGSVTINQLLAKEAFGARLDQQLPVSFHELFYPLLQGYDSVEIRADVELGGTDQRFNILQGRELQPHYMQDQQVALLVPLLEGTDGVKKMSKSYDNYIALKDEPDTMLGKVMRIPDVLIIKYFELATTLTGDQIDKMKDEINAGKNPKDLKIALGKQIVNQYYGSERAQQAVEEWEKVHSARQIPDQIDQFKLKESVQLFRLLVDSGLAASAAEAKRLITQGGVRIDGEQIADANHQVEACNGLSIVVQVGRRRFIRVVT